jgi:hypothetical protein
VLVVNDGVVALLQDFIHVGVFGCLISWVITTAGLPALGVYIRTVFLSVVLVDSSYFRS